MEHGVAESEEMKKGNRCAEQTFSYKKINDISVAAEFLVLNPVVMFTKLSNTMLLVIW